MNEYDQNPGSPLFLDSLFAIRRSGSFENEGVEPGLRFNPHQPSSVKSWDKHKYLCVFCFVIINLLYDFNLFLVFRAISVAISESKSVCCLVFVCCWRIRSKPWVELIFTGPGRFRSQSDGTVVRSGSTLDLLTQNNWDYLGPEVGGISWVGGMIPAQPVGLFSDAAGRDHQILIETGILSSLKHPLLVPNRPSSSVSADSEPPRAGYQIRYSGYHFLKSCNEWSFAILILALQVTRENSYTCVSN